MGKYLRQSMNRSDLRGGLWVHRSLLDSALRHLRRVERELRMKRAARVARGGSGYHLGRHLATYERARFDLISYIANCRPGL